MLELAVSFRGTLRSRGAPRVAQGSLGPLSSGKAFQLQLARRCKAVHSGNGGDAGARDIRLSAGGSTFLAETKEDETTQIETDRDASTRMGTKYATPVEEGGGDHRHAFPVTASQELKQAAASNWGFPPIPFVARGRSMPGQRLLPCTREDAAILSNAQSKYPSPQEVEGGIIVRIIAARDAHRVTSPVLRVVRNRQYGIRSGERMRLALGGAFFTAALVSLGVWQLFRMEEKRKLIEYRRSHLAMQPRIILSSPFPWTLEAAASSEKRQRQADQEAGTVPAPRVSPVALSATGFSSRASEAPPPTQQTSTASGELAGGHAACTGCPGISQGQGNEKLNARGLCSGSLLAAASADDVEKAVAAWAYTPVVVRGVLDSTTELLVGPRPGLEMGNPGYCVVSPLRLQDGSVILVNKGHLSLKLAKLPPFARAVSGQDNLASVVNSQRQLLAKQQTLGSPQAFRQVEQMQQQNVSRQYLDLGLKQHLERLQEVAGSRTEPVGTVTVRGILEPGEVANSGFKSLMLKNRPHDCQFLVLNPKDLVTATPGVPNRREASLLMVNAYSIVYDEDVPQSYNGITGSILKTADRFRSYEQKQKADYLLFYADEHTHFNYACQWFLMGLCSAAMTIYKLVEVSRWRW